MPNHVVEHQNQFLNLINDKNVQMDVKKAVKAGTVYIYFKLLIDAIVSICVIILFYNIISGFSSDLHKIQEEGLENQRKDIEECAKEYENNHCSEPNLPDLVEQKCRDFEICKNMTPRPEPISQILFRYIPQRINDLTESLTMKSLFLVIIVTLGLLWIRKVGLL